MSRILSEERAEKDEQHEIIGGLTDKYGINWQVNIEAKKE